MPTLPEIPEDSICFFNGGLRPLKDAQVSLATHALNYGTGCFEGLRAYWNSQRRELYVVKAREHFQRFMRSARILKMTIPYTVEELIAIMADILRANAFSTDVYIRPLAFKGSRAIAITLSGLTDTVGMFAFAMGDYVPRSGLSVQVSSWQRLADNMIPTRAKVTGAYINAALASDAAKADGYDEALMLGSDGHVAEASSSNLFIVRNGTMITPPVTADILEGITRQLIIELAQDLTIPVEIRPIDRSELYIADEVFLCGTGVQIAGIVSVDRRTISDGRPGPITEAVQSLYFRAVRGEEPRYLSWLTPIYGRT